MAHSTKPVIGHLGWGYESKTLQTTMAMGRPISSAVTYNSGYLSNGDGSYAVVDGFENYFSPGLVITTPMATSTSLCARTERRKPSAGVD